MSRKWFQLVGQDGNALTTVTSVSVDVEDVDMFRKAVFAEVSPTLPKNVIASDLTVFADRTAYDEKQKLPKSSSSVAEFGKDEDNALIVKAVQKKRPAEEVSSANVVLDEKRQRTVCINSDMQTALEFVAKLGQQLNVKTDLAVGNLLRTLPSVLGVTMDKGLYIRKEYCDIVDIIKQVPVPKTGKRKILAIGSPGIGKSVFGIFVLLLLMTQKQDVAYRPLGEPSPFYFTYTDAGGYEFSEVALSGRSYDCLFDGNETGGALSSSSFRSTFVFASPRSENYNNYVKELCFKVYMNPWTRDECQRLADAIPVEDHDDWLQKYNLLGGKPRFLFSPFHTYDSLTADVQSAIPSTLDDLKGLVKNCDDQAFDKKMRHILLYFYRAEHNPSIFFLAYSTLVVESIICARYNIGSADEIRRLLTTPVPNLQSWRGKEL